MFCRLSVGARLARVSHGKQLKLDMSRCCVDEDRKYIMIHLALTLAWPRIPKPRTLNPHA